jgi:hypothetical protein
MCPTNFAIGDSLIYAPAALDFIVSIGIKAGRFYEKVTTQQQHSINSLLFLKKLNGSKLKQ